MRQTKFLLPMFFNGIKSYGTNNNQGNNQLTKLTKKPSQLTGKPATQTNQLPNEQKSTN